MLLLYSLIEVIGGMAISLGVGASTFALIFYFMGMRHSELYDTGRMYQKVVYIVLRVAMMLILLTQVTRGVIYMYNGVSLKQLLAADALIFMWTVVAVLFVNAILMTMHLMPRKLGPAIQATSWYTLGVMATLPPQVVTFTYFPLILTYAGCILAVAVIIEMIMQKITLKTIAEVAVETVVVVTDAVSGL